MVLLVSILIPNYNKAPYIRETLDSVLAQTYTNWECIIVDDHSTDDSWEILQEYQAKDSRFKIYKRPDHLPKGGNACRNYAFKLSKGEYVNWFDSDDVMEDFFLRKRVDLFIEKNKLNYVIGSGRRFQESLKDSEIVFSPYFYLDDILNSFLRFDPPWLAPSCTFSRIFLLKNKLFWTEEIQVLQDVVFNLEVYLSSKNYAVVNSDPDWHWRLDKSKKSKSFTINHIENLKTFNQLINKYGKFKSTSKIDTNQFRLSCLEIFLFTKNKYGFRWIKKIVFSFFRNKILSISQTKTVLIDFILFLLVKTFNKSQAIDIKKNNLNKIKGFILIIYEKEKIIGKSTLNDFYKEKIKYNS